MRYNIKIEFGKQTKKFRLHFGLGQKELAKLSNMSPSEYSDLENGVTNYNVEKLQNISSVYGLLYYQMGNPKCRFPAFNKLPDKTKKAINARKEPLKIYKERLIIEHLTLLFGELSKGNEFLIKEIGAKINERYDIQYEDEEISGTINKNFSEYVVKTQKKYTAKKGPGAKPSYYKLIKKIPARVLVEAKEKVGK